LIDLCVIECKDGYARDSIADLLDKEPRHKPKYEQFIRQAKKARKQSRSRSWLLIARRRGRQIMIFMPRSLLTDMQVSFEDCIMLYSPLGPICGCRLKEFLQSTTRDDVGYALS
jgi:hypothetical protein